MLHHGRTGLTEAVVTGLGRAVLFCGRQSLGEGLHLGKARDASFTLTRAGTWIGILAYFAPDPLTIREGQQVIVQAITECQSRWEDQDIHEPIQCPPSHSDSIIKVSPPQKEHPKGAGLHSQHHPIGHPEAGIMAIGDGTGGQFNPSHPHPCQIRDSKVIEVRCWQLLQCPHSWTGLKTHGIPNMADDVGRPEPTWRLIYPSLKMRTQRMPSPTRVGGGTWPYTIKQGVETVSSCLMPSDPSKVMQESLWGALGWT